MRIGQEPPDLFRRTVTAKAQAHGHLGPQPTDSLERLWQAAEREG